MPRSGAEARLRLREAALELYRERGFDATTTAQIAERAGVTERTYFRHFADKREVLFDEAELRALMLEAIAGAAVDLPPLTVVIGSYLAAVPLLERNRAQADLRAEIILATPALQERAHAKSAALTEMVIDALVERGAPEPTARLAAQVGQAVFDRAARAWAAQPKRDLADLIAEASDELSALI